MAHIAAALNWAKRMGLLAVVPAIERPRRAKGGKLMKGRPDYRRRIRPDCWPSAPK